MWTPLGGRSLYNNNNQVGTDGYLLLINGATFPPGVTHPDGFAGALLNFERMPGPDRLIDFDVFGGDGGATSGQGIVRGIKKDYFICGLTDVPEEDLEPPFERLSPTTGGYDFLMLNCVRGRDGRISRYRYRWGGAGDDFATACAVDHWGNLITVGYTNGNGFPIVQGAVQSEFAGGPWDGVLVKWKKPLICAITDAASFRPDCVVPGGIISVFGHWVGHRQRRIFELDSLLRFSTNLFGLEAYILGSDDRRYDCVPIFGSKAQSNIVVNGRVPVGPAKFCLIYKGVRSYLYDITVLPHKPACFPNPATNGYGAILRFPDNTVAAPGVSFPAWGGRYRLSNGPGTTEAVDFHHRNHPDRRPVRNGKRSWRILPSGTEQPADKEQRRGIRREAGPGPNLVLWAGARLHAGSATGQLRGFR